MYYEDLSVYRVGEREYPGIYSIGWLGRGFEYPKGISPDGFYEKLEWIVFTRNESFDASMLLSRGIEDCFICGQEISMAFGPGKPELVGIREIWIPHDGKWYACPCMIAHYVRDHQYLPPKVFLDAVSQLDITKPLNSEKYA